MVATPTQAAYQVNDAITCSAVGSPVLSYQWSVNSTVHQGSMLTVTRDMAGPVLLKCTTNNMYGTNQLSFSSTVEGRDYSIHIYLT